MGGVRYSPVGEVDLILSVPVSQPTCVAFGGSNLNTLFVTSTTASLVQTALSQEPDAGTLFIYATEATDVQECEFKPEITGAIHTSK